MKPKLINTTFLYYCLCTATSSSLMRFVRSSAFHLACRDLILACLASNVDFSLDKRGSNGSNHCSSIPNQLLEAKTPVGLCCLLLEGFWLHYLLWDFCPKPLDLWLFFWFLAWDFSTIEERWTGGGIAQNWLKKFWPTQGIVRFDRSKAELLSFSKFLTYILEFWLVNNLYFWTLQRAPRQKIY